VRIHGGYGYSQEYEIERLYRDVPMLLIGEGTAEIQKMIIGRRLLTRFAATWGGLPTPFHDHGQKWAVSGANWPRS
jgi:Acyl-CoA dehydrogenase, C-terminal domain